VYAWEAEPRTVSPVLSCARMDTLYVPVEVAVPDIVPLSESRSPGGSDPDVRAYESGPLPPEPGIAYVKATPSSGAGAAAESTTVG